MSEVGVQSGVNLAAGAISTIVVGIFVVAKFTEGAWLVVVVFPILVFGLMRLNRRYRAEAAVLEMSRTERPEFTRHARLRVFLFVDTIDLAEMEALRYGKGLHAEELIAVHFVVDGDHAEQLQERWQHFEHDAPLRVIDCPDRNLGRVAQELVMQVKRDHPESKVTVLLPRRTIHPLLGRLLHDRTADKMARAVSRIPGATAIIVPYDVESRIARGGPMPTKNRSRQKLARRERKEVEGKAFRLLRAERDRGRRSLGALTSDPPQADPGLIP